VSEGFNFSTIRDWYLRFANIREVANNDHYEVVNGIRIKLALSAMSTVIKGWAHGTIIGGSFTQIKGPDVKIGLGGAFSFLARGKTEITHLNKDEKIFGWKISHVRGKKNKLTVGNEVHNSAVKLAQNKNKCAEYWTMRKEMEKALEIIAKHMDRQHTSVSNNYFKLSWEANTVDKTVKEFQEKASQAKSTYKKLLEECSTVKEHASGQFTIIADSAAEVLADGNWEGYARGDVKLLGSSLQTFAASITKLG
jgi:hypothetical protein